MNEGWSWSLTYSEPTQGFVLTIDPPSYEYQAWKVFERYPTWRQVQAAIANVRAGRAIDVDAQG